MKSQYKRLENGKTGFKTNQLNLRRRSDKQNVRMLSGAALLEMKYKRNNDLHTILQLFNDN